MAGTVASVVTQTFAGLTADGKRIYNVKAVMTATATAENKTTIGVTRLKKILGTPSFAIVGNDVGTARYVTDTSTDGTTVTLTVDTDVTNTKILTFVGQVYGL
jgi:uncharacterized lipoprotein YajG